MFYPDCDGKTAHAVFSLEFDSKVAPAPVTRREESETFEKGSILICVDDDKGPRLLYKSLAQKLGANNSMILGEFYAEVDCLVETVLKAERDHGPRNVICIFDQNMDRYSEGAILGTDVTQTLRASGFKGLVFIRSANDDMASRVTYKNAGADGTLNKGTTPMADLVATTMAVYRQFLIMGPGSEETHEYHMSPFLDPRSDLPLNLASLTL